MSSHSRSSERVHARSRGRWSAALLFTLVWHVIVFLGVDTLELFAADPVPPRSDPVQLTFAPRATPESTPERDADDPDFFTELPEDRADLAPDEADALSNVDSRARDTAEGDERTDLPRMEGRGEAPQVGLQASPEPDEIGAGTPDATEEPDDVTPSPEESSDETPAPIEDDTAGDRAEVGESPETGVTGGGPTDARELNSAQGDPGEALRSGRIEASPQPRFLVGRGRDDIYQEEMDNRRGNVPLFGDISLNTVAWNWAPWLQRFAREFHRNWVPPYAYWIGLIEGSQLVEVEIGPDGSLLRLDVVEENGHESLREATVGNFRSIAPYQPLPADFPEPTLRLTVRVHYPGRD